MKDLLLKLFFMVATWFGIKRSGAIEERKNQAEQAVAERANDAKIAASPFVDDPFDRMRNSDDVP